MLGGGEGWYFICELLYKQANTAHLRCGAPTSRSLGRAFSLSSHIDLDMADAGTTPFGLPPMSKKRARNGDDDQDAFVYGRHGKVQHHLTVLQDPSLCC